MEMKEALASARLFAWPGTLMLVAAKNSLAARAIPARSAHKEPEGKLT